MEKLNVKYNLVDPATALFTDVEPPHERGECIVAGLWWCVDESERIDERSSGMTDFLTYPDDNGHSHLVNCQEGG